MGVEELYKSTQDQVPHLCAREKEIKPSANRMVATTDYEETPKHASGKKVCSVTSLYERKGKATSRSVRS